MGCSLGSKHAIPPLCQAPVTPYIFTFLFHFYFNTGMCLRIFAALGVGFLPHFHPNSDATSYITLSSNSTLLKNPSLGYSLLFLYSQPSTYHIVLWLCVYRALRSKDRSSIFNVPAQKVMALHQQKLKRSDGSISELQLSVENIPGDLENKALPVTFEYQASSRG